MPVSPARCAWIVSNRSPPIQQMPDACPMCPVLIGADHVLFGSDFPHAEGLAEPTEFVNDLEGYSAAETRMVMRDTGFRWCVRFEPFMLA
jgi:hypothetical protein